MKIEVSIPKQSLSLLTPNGDLIHEWPVSTATRGAGERMGSNCTPRGKHIVRAKIGAAAPINSVFVGRRPTGEIYSEALAEKFPERDWILTRILWLSGTERGFNRLGAVDTMRRYIYIHGTPDISALGAPVSHGCIRMSSLDIMALFDLSPIYTPVHIME